MAELVGFVPVPFEFPLPPVPRLVPPPPTALPPPLRGGGFVVPPPIDWGKKLADKIAHWILCVIFPKSCVGSRKEGQPGVVPFQGGQVEGVTYTIHWQIIDRYIIDNNPDGTRITDPTRTYYRYPNHINIRGKILDIVLTNIKGEKFHFSKIVTGYWNNNLVYYYNSLGDGYIQLASLYENGGYVNEISIMGVEREDGTSLLDDRNQGGDPPPYGGTPDTVTKPATKPEIKPPPGTPRYYPPGPPAPSPRRKKPTEEPKRTAPPPTKTPKPKTPTPKTPPPTKTPKPKTPTPKAPPPTKTPTPKTPTPKTPTPKTPTPKTPKTNPPPTINPKPTPDRPATPTKKPTRQPEPYKKPDPYIKPERPPYHPYQPNEYPSRPVLPDVSPYPDVYPFPEIKPIPGIKPVPSTDPVVTPYPQRITPPIPLPNSRPGRVPLPDTAPVIVPIPVPVPIPIPQPFPLPDPVTTQPRPIRTPIIPVPIPFPVPIPTPPIIFTPPPIMPCDPCVAVLEYKLDNLVKNLQPYISGAILTTGCQPTDITAIPFNGAGLLGLSSQIMALADQIDLIRQQLCQADCVAAVPAHYSSPPGSGVQQLVLLLAPQNPDGSLGRADTQIVVPHWALSKDETKRINLNYTKGLYFSQAWLPDGSKMAIYCYSATEGKRVLGILSQFISGAYRPSRFSFSETQTTKSVLNRTVYLKYAKFFSAGRERFVPDWVVSFV